MSDATNRPLSDFSLLELFRVEAEQQSTILVDGLLALDRDANDLRAIHPLMRAAHSIKGAASIVNLQPIVRLAHAMEECLVAAQGGSLKLSRSRVDSLLEGVDMITRVSLLTDDAAPGWFEENESDMAGLIDRISGPEVDEPIIGEPENTITADKEDSTIRPSEQVLRIGVKSFDHLLGLATESVIASNALLPVVESMQRFKKKQNEVFSLFDELQQILAASDIDGAIKDKASAALQKINPVKQQLVDRMSDLETCGRRLTAVSKISLDAVLALRMRPFRDGIQAFPRMVRDLGRSMGKEVRLVISGENTQVDRDILAKLESPLNHILRNAIDHGMESPDERVASGKPREGIIRLVARHRSGMLSIEVSDDGRGIDPDKIRSKIVQRNMLSESMATALSKSELLEFLFLPAFSLKETTTEISGRGVGLDVVRDIVRQQFGAVKIESDFGKHFQTFITLPLTQSVVRTLLVDIAGEPYAIPITRINRVARFDRADIQTFEDKPFVTFAGEHIGLVSGAQLLGAIEKPTDAPDLPVIMIGSGLRRYALVVDAIIGEQDLAVIPLEATFGKLRDISAAGLLDNGTPVLVLDIDDLTLSIEKLLSEGNLSHLHATVTALSRKMKRILVVDDSMTVREMERKLLVNRGFAVEVAIDGIDGWNAVRSNEFDLVITDVDMPRMDGIELVTLIKKDGRLKSLPVMIVSYKDRPEDRTRGISAGADYYLTKGSFHDETLLEAVFDLIGAGRA